jgi:hypothetical protein
VGSDGRGGGWGGKLSALLHVHRGSRASSRKSSRASDASDASDLGTASALFFQNFPLLMLSGATGTHEDLQPPALTVSRPSPTAEHPSAASSSGSESHATARSVTPLETRPRELPHEPLTRPWLTAYPRTCSDNVHPFNKAHPPGAFHFISFHFTCVAENYPKLCKIMQNYAKLSEFSKLARYFNSTRFNCPIFFSFLSSFHSFFNDTLYKG